MKEQLHGDYIEELMNNRWNTFQQWVQETGAHQTLDIPQDVADVFIPRRILELAENPSNVKSLVLPLTPNPKFNSQIDFFIYERLNHSLSDQNAYEVWKQEIGNKGNYNLPSPTQVSPLFPGIDNKHVFYKDEINEGIFTLNDKIFLEYSADVPKDNPNVVVTRILRDRAELQRQGIGSSFYNRLESVLKELGFEYLVGQIVSPHKSFYEKNRARYIDLPLETRKNLPFYIGFEAGITFVKTL